MQIGKMLSVREAAAYAGISTKTVRRHIARGLLEHELVPGRFGNEIRVSKRSLDKTLGQFRKVSKGDGGLHEVTRLYRKAPAEVREVVLKILRSSSGGEEEKKNGGLLAGLFRRKGADFR